MYSKFTFSRTIWGNSCFFSESQYTWFWGGCRLALYSRIDYIKFGSTIDGSKFLEIEDGFLSLTGLMEERWVNEVHIKVIYKDRYLVINGFRIVQTTAPQCTPSNTRKDRPLCWPGCWFSRIAGTNYLEEWWWCFWTSLGFQIWTICRTPSVSPGSDWMSSGSDLR